MHKALIGLMCILLGGAGITYGMAINNAEELPLPEGMVVIEFEDDTDIIDTDTVPDEEITQEEMVADIIGVWEIFFRDANVRQSDWRRDHFQEHAKSMAKWITYYQNNPADIGGQLPKHGSTHMLAAVIVTKESSVDHMAIGPAPRFEAGLFQVWDVAAAGYSKDEIRRNPELGIMLGIRWMAHSTSQCKKTRIPVDTVEWRTSDWLGPMTAYGSKPKKFRRKNGTCKVFGFAKDRINLVRIYMDRVDAERQKEGLTKEA